MDEKGILYAQDIFDGFSEENIELIRMEAAPIEIMPDPSISVEDMEKYGYAYKGMVPMGGEVASEYFKQGSMMIYALHHDGSETVVGNEKQLAHHIENGGLFVIDKLDWMSYLENGSYLRAAEITEEQNYNIIDGRKNNAKSEQNRTGEKPSVLGRLRKKQEQLAQAKKDVPTPEKKSERKMP